MSLIKCPKCKHQVSSTAKACPHCGARAKKTSLFTWLATIIAVPIVIAAFIMSAPPPRPPEDPKLAAERKQAEERLQKVMAYGTTLKASMRDPKSLEWIDILANENASVVCFAYRARNAVGNMTVERVAILNGKLIPEASGWNNNCRGRSLFDVIRARESIR